MPEGEEALTSQGYIVIIMTKELDRSGWEVNIEHERPPPQRIARIEEVNPSRS